MNFFLKKSWKWFKRRFDKLNPESKIWRSITINDKVFENITDFPKQLSDYLKQVDAAPKSITMYASTNNAMIINDFGGVLISHKNLAKIMKDYPETKSILHQYDDKPYAKIMDDELHKIQNIIKRRQP